MITGIYIFNFIAPQQRTFDIQKACRYYNLHIPFGVFSVKNFRVLIVDDEERIRNFLSSKLNASGYTTITAHNGKEGLEQVQAQEPDLIVLDIIMPKMDGIKMLQELRSFFLYLLSSLRPKEVTLIE